MLRTRFSRYSYFPFLDVLLFCTVYKAMGATWGPLVSTSCPQVGFPRTSYISCCRYILNILVPSLIVELSSVLAAQVRRHPCSPSAFLLISSAISRNIRSKLFAGTGAVTLLSFLTLRFLSTPPLAVQATGHSLF